ncbi:helix-turn-helix domain-containing protein [Microbacteriaceae bacterium 4G12]
MQLQYTILYGLKLINGERTSSSIYHLLKGKRSSQTLQDGNMYHLSFLFGTYKKINRHEYDKQIETLLIKNWIREIQENTYIVTEKGIDQLASWSNVYAFPTYLHGLQWGEAGNIFWKRISLIVQTVSHLQKRIPTFLPIQQELEVTSWVKNFFLSSHYSRSALVEALYKECVQVLSQLSEPSATIFVWRLSGYERIGYTEQQIARIAEIDPFRVHILFVGTLHYIVQVVQGNDQYPLLSKIVPHQDKVSSMLSLSTKKTYTLWKQGKTMEQIAGIRRLKLNTIEDHIVEIALHDPQFVIESFVTTQKVHMIQEAVSRLQIRKLRMLKQQLGESVSYFEIRLVLARLGGSYEAGGSFV